MANSEKRHINLAGVTSVGGSGGSAKKVSKSRKSGSMMRAAIKSHGKETALRKEPRGGRKRPVRRD